MAGLSDKEGCFHTAAFCSAVSGRGAAGGKDTSRNREQLEDTDKTLLGKHRSQQTNTTAKTADLMATFSFCVLLSRLS